MANYTDSTTSSDVGLCRFASQDTSYMFVHEDAPIVVHNPHPMELAQDSTWHRPWNHEPKANNVAVMHGIRGWTPYDPDNRDPGYVGRRVNVAMITFRDMILKKKPKATETKLLCYMVDATFNSPNQTSTFSAKVAVGDNMVVYMEFRRDGKTDQKTGYHKGCICLLWLSDNPR